MKREVIISFDNEKCMHCGNCVEECPSGIIMQTKGEVPYVEDVRRCIECGHCVSVCAKEAIHHSDFPQVFSYRSEDLPKAESLLLLMKSRRAIRNFQEKPIPKDILSKIVEAGHTAPTAENSLSVRTLLITDKEKMKEISSFTLNTFGKIMGIVNSPIVKFVLKPLKPELYEKIGELRTMIENFENGKDDVLNGCSALLLFYAPKEDRFAVENCNLAYQNASLMAEVLGIGHFYTGFVLAGNHFAFGKSLEKLLSIKGKICAGMAMGYPKHHYPNYIEKLSGRTNLNP